MQYHPQAPAAAAASINTKRSSKTFFNPPSRASRPRFSRDLFDRFGHLPAVQILLQNQGRSHSVHARSRIFFLLFSAGGGLYRPPLLLFEHALRFPTRQPLVDHLNGQPKLLVHALPEPRRFFRHLPARSIQSPWQPHHNLPHSMLTHQLPQPPHIFIPVDSFERSQRLRQPSLSIGNRQPDPGAPIIQRQNTRQLSNFTIASRLTHTSSIPGSNSQNVGCCLRIDY